MTNLNNNMTITSTALTHMSKELIDQRKFNPASVIVVGSPSLINGIAGSFNSNSYYKKENIDFQEATEFSLDIKSTFLKSTTSQVLFSLIDNKSAYSIIGKATTNSISIELNSTPIINLPIPLVNESEIQLKLEFTETQVNLIVFCNSETYTATEAGIFSSVVANVYNLYIGADPTGSNLYWAGTVDLNSLVIKANQSEIFSTGTLAGYKFNKLIVSDNSVTLDDNTSELLGHVAECPLEEIVRTENNVLLKATIGSDINIDIQQAGLYCTDGENSILFSIIQNLSIQKGDSLTYSLILHVKLDVNVVNITVSPDIIIKEDDSVSMSDFETVKRGHTYTSSNLERMIKENSLGLGNYRCSLDMANSETRVNADGTETLPTRTMMDSKPSGIGYNRAQSNYKIQKGYNELQDAYSASLGYSKVQEKGRVYTDYVFSDENIEKEGSVLVKSNGEASIFSNVSYVSSSAPSITEAFEFCIAFKASTSNAGTVCCVKADSKCQPLVLSVAEGKVHLSLGQAEKLVVVSNGMLATYNRSTKVSISGTSYYRWSYSGAKDIPSALFTTEIAPTESTILYKMDSTTSSLVTFEGTVSAFVSGNIIDEDLVKVETGTKQYIKISFDGNKYIIYTRKENEDYLVCSEKITPLTAGSSTGLLFGINYSEGSYSNYFHGIIYLAEFKMSTSTNEISYLVPVTKGTVILQNYYHIPLELKSYYNVYDLVNYSDNYSLNIQEGAIEGRKDKIDFTDEGGFSLCIKAKLEDSTNKVILSKINLGSGTVQFAFEIKDSKITFTLYSAEDTIVLSKALNAANFRRYLNFSGLFTITASKVTADKVTYKLYMNKELLDSINTSPVTFSSGTCSLANYLESKEEAEKNYVSDIISFKNELTEEDIFYLCNVLDTNF